LPDPAKNGVYRWILLLSCIRAKIYGMSHLYFLLMAAIFDL